MLKRKNKKKQEEINRCIEKSQDALTKLVDDYQEYEILNAEKIGNALDFNYPRVYLYMLCNYAEDINILVSNKRYPSLYPLLNNFLECYGLGENMITLYFDDKERYNHILKRYYAATLEQRRTECVDFNSDFDIPYENGAEFFNIRLNQMEKIIEEFFDEYSDGVEEINREFEILDIVKNIGCEYKLPLDYRSKVIGAIKNNIEFTEEEKKSAIKLYISSKSASQNNIQTTLTRVLGMVEGSPALILNKNEGIAPLVLEIVEKCLKNITEKVIVGFDNI